MNRMSLSSSPRTAAEWFAARLGARDADAERRFAEWLAQDPKNAEEYSLCGLTWEISESVAAGLESHGTVRRAWYRRGLGVAATVAAVLIGGATWWFVTPTHSQWNTAPGEQRTFTLEDGSRIVVNTRSKLEVRMGRSKREVRLLEGEAFFEVARDPSRPFLVVTSLGVARAVGTRFNVLLDDGREEVVTEEGKVLVQVPDGGTASVLAVAGTKATLVQGQSQPSLAPADLTRIENWRARRLEFDRVPLEVALKEFSRYTTVPIRAASEDVAQTYISAVLRTGDVQALATTLQGALGLSLVPGQHEWLVVESAHHSETPGKEAAEHQGKPAEPL